MSTSATELFTPELCFFDWECADTTALFTRLGEVLGEGGYISDGWFEGITTRERNYPTGLRTPTVCCAIPHTDPEFIARPYIAIVRPAAPVMFEAMAGMGDPVPADIIVNLGIRHEGGQVEALQGLMGVFMDAEKTAWVMAQRSGAGLVEAITGCFE